MNIALFVGVFLVFLGGIFFIFSLVAISRSKSAQSWPTAPATILSSEIVRHEDTDSEGGGSVTYEPLVTYQYTILGQTYTGKRIAFGANRFDFRKAQEVSARYPAGARVNVYYNPDKPSSATLETIAAGGKLLLVLGSVLALVGLITVVVSLLW